MRITVEWLAAREACEDEVKVFVAEWPEGTEVTPEALRRAVELDIDVDWFAAKFLKGGTKEKYLRATNAAKEEFRRDIDVAEEKFRHDTAPAREEYDRAIEAAEKNYDRDTDVAEENYDHATKAAKEKFSREFASTRKRLYLVCAEELIKIIEDADHENHD